MDASELEHFKSFRRRFPLGLVVITTRQPDGGVHGLTTEAAMSVAEDPPMVLFFLGRKRGTFENMEREGRFGMCILAEDQANWSEYFSTQPRPPKPPGSMHTAPGGVGVIDDSLAFFDCKVAAIHVAGENTMLVIGEVDGIEVREGSPLIFLAGEYLAAG
jgi:flavin reductase (DIM6/NTAB) family NADH-FMN oxidoreductase RutF